MSITQNAILEKKNSLHRTPPPRAPLKKESPPRNNQFQNRSDDSHTIAQLIPSVKLKKTGFRDSLIAEDIDNKNTANADEPISELQSLMARRRAMFEHKEEEEIKPKPKPKPKPPKLAPENVKREEDKENETKVRSDSGSDAADESKDILTDSNKNIVCRDSRGEPKLCVLPTLESLGKPPPKCPKPENLTKLLENYDSNKIVMSPRRSTLNRMENNSSLDHSIVEEEDGEEEYDDVDEDLKAQILGRNEAEQEEQTTAEEGIMEENYDDVDEMKAKVEEINNAETKIPEPISEESYDDLDTVAEQAREQLQNDFAAEGEIFGEEMYDAVGARLDGEPEVNEEDASDSPIEHKFSPSAVPSSANKEKGKKDHKKEMENQKKKEREEQKRRKEEEKRREREEKEEKRRKEEEKKKRDRDDKELRKKHKLKAGAEGNGVGEAKRNFPGDGKFELPVKEGETLVIISEKGCPQGKWLIKNPEGHLGYLPTELIQLKVDSEGNRISTIITEDFYEDVDQYQGATQIEEEDDQEVYDDIAAGQEPIDEDLYEELPADQ